MTNSKKDMLDWLLKGVQSKVISELKAKKLYEEKYAKVSMLGFVKMLYEV